MRTTRFWSVAGLALAGLALAGCATSAGGGEDASAVVGTWQSSEPAQPFLTFEDDGTFHGNDGCNGLSGTYELDGDAVQITFSAGTLKACEGVDPWLSSLAKVTVADTTLEVYDKDGELLGSLAREG